MNLLEHYIIKVHSITSCTIDDGWNTPQIANNYVEVEHTTNCHGCIKTHKKVFTIQEWTEIEKKGFYLA